MIRIPAKGYRLVELAGYKMCICIDFDHLRTRRYKLKTEQLLGEASKDGRLLSVNTGQRGLTGHLRRQLQVAVCGEVKQQTIIIALERRQLGS